MITKFMGSINIFFGMNELIECQRDDRLALSSSDYIITMMKIIMQTSPYPPLRMTRLKHLRVLSGKF